jgi:hypothetical protein
MLAEHHLGFLPPQSKQTYMTLKIFRFSMNLKFQASFYKSLLFIETETQINRVLIWAKSKIIMYLLYFLEFIKVSTKLHLFLRLERIQPLNY